MSIDKDDYASNIIECKQSKNSAFEWVILKSCGLAKVV